MVRRKSFLEIVLTFGMFFILSGCGMDGSSENITNIEMSDKLENTNNVDVEDHETERIVDVLDDGEEDNHDDLETEDFDNSSITENDLRKCITEFSNDEMAGEPVVADFDGDGQPEMVAEYGCFVSENGFDLRKQYFIYTNGTNTYSFGEYLGGYLYETESYIIKIENGCHFAFTSNWRVEALGGQMYSAGVYGLSPTAAECFLATDFCSLTSKEKGTINITYYKEADAGSSNIIREEVWKWNGEDYENVIEKAYDSELLPDGLYYTTDYLNVGEYVADGGMKYLYIDEKNHTITIASTLERKDEVDLFTTLEEYEFKERTFSIDDDFKIYGVGGEGPPEEYTIEKINSWWEDKNGGYHFGIGIALYIQNGTVSKLELWS